MRSLEISARFESKVSELISEVSESIVDESDFGEEALIEEGKDEG